MRKVKQEMADEKDKKQKNPKPADGKPQGKKAKPEQVDASGGEAASGKPARPKANNRATARLREKYVKEVLPVLKSQPGFLEILPFVPETKTERMITITLWAEKRDAERYERETYPKVEATLRPYLAAPVLCRHYNVETSLCQHFVAALTA